MFVKVGLSLESCVQELCDTGLGDTAPNNHSDPPLDS